MVNPILFTGTAAAVALAGLPAVATTTSQARTHFAGTIAYEAEMEMRESGRILRAAALYDRRKFRVVTFRPSLPNRPPVPSIEVYSAGSPPVVWAYGAAKRSAWPNMESIFFALAREFKVAGEATVRRRYHIPAEFRMPSGRETEPKPPPMLLAGREALDARTWKRGGAEPVAGFPCDVCTAQESTGAGASRMERNWRAWVERKTGFVLRWEMRTAFGFQPPQSRSFRVTRLRFLPSVRPSEFELPSDVTANVPKLFESVSLPKGVKRVPATGPFADTGIGFGPCAGGTAVR